MPSPAPPRLLVLLILICQTALSARAHGQVRAYKVQHGHLSPLLIDQGAQWPRLVRVNAAGRAVGRPFDVLVQHRSGPADQDIDERWQRADSLITCFPASIADPAIRAKTILKDKTGAIEIRRYVHGIVVVEPVQVVKKPPDDLSAPPAACFRFGESLD